jgi:DNA-binding transcriptional LysR family regulator
MTFSDASLTALRVFREVAERGTLTAAATALGYTQSAVSRQIASLERAAGVQLVERRHDGVRLTPAGHVVVRRRDRDGRPVVASCRADRRISGAGRPR